MAVVEEFASNIISNLPIDLLTRINNLITFAQALGIVFILYVAYYIFNVILNQKRYNKLKKMEKDIEEIKKILKRKK